MYKRQGTDNPAGRGEQSSRELLSKLQLFKGEKGIKPHKKDDQDGQGNQGADTEQIWGNMFQYRQIAKQEPLQRSAEYHEYKRHNADQDKEDVYKRQGKETHSWFVGYAPAENPKIAISVIAEEAGSGGKVAAPIARAVFDAYFAKQ